MSASVQIDDEEDLILDLALPDHRIGFILSRDAKRAGWYFVARGPDGPDGNSGPLTVEQVAILAKWSKMPWKIQS